MHSIQVRRLIAFSASQAIGHSECSGAVAHSSTKNVTKVNPWMYVASLSAKAQISEKLPKYSQRFCRVRIQPKIPTTMPSV